MSLAEVLIVGLAAWRLANLIIEEEGPWNVFWHFRDVAIPTDRPIEGWSKLWTCIYCLSLYTGALFWVLWQFTEIPAILFAISAVQVALGELVQCMRRLQRS